MARMKHIIPELIGMGQLQRETTKTIRRIAQDSQEAFIVSHNKPRAVLLSLGRYEALKMLETKMQQEASEVEFVVARGDQEFKTRKTIVKKSMKQLLAP